MSDSYEYRADFVKADETLGLVFGWALVCKRDGEEYFDLQGDHITESAMLEAAADFAQADRVAGDMHKFADGTAVFLFPLTTEVAKAYHIESATTGLMIAVKPSAEVFEKFRSGNYTGFSIGGRVLPGGVEVVEA